MGRKLYILVFCSLVFICFDSAKANAEQSSRKGFFLSLFGFFGSEVSETQALNSGGGIRVGGGITDDVLLYAELGGSAIQKTILDHLLFSDVQLKGQYYVWQDLYFNLGVGVVTMLSTADLVRSSVTTLKLYDSGFSMSAGAGYEFRLGKRFFISPEFRLSYQHVKSANFITPEICGQLGWHF